MQFKKTLHGENFLHEISSANCSDSWIHGAVESLFFFHEKQKRAKEEKQKNKKKSKIRRAKEQDKKEETERTEKEQVTLLT